MVWLQTTFLTFCHLNFEITLVIIFVIATTSLQPYTRLETFKRSFFPTSIRLWNALPHQTRQILSPDVFKRMLCNKFNEPNILYYYGERWTSVHHTRIRIGCSKLNADLCFKLHVRDSPACLCGSPVEDANHYFFHCPRFTDIREDLLLAVAHFIQPSVKILLVGDPNLSLVQNKLIFDAVHKFIKDSNRFT